MPIKAETTITKKVYKDAYKYSLLKKPSGLATIIIPLILIVSAACMYIAIVPSLLGALLVPVLCLLFISIQPVLNYSINVSQIKTQYFTFEEYFFTVCTEQNVEGEPSKIKYSSLCQIHETKNYFYIYDLARQLFIVCKNQIENASPEQLRNLLQNNMPKSKYKRFGV